MPPLPKNLVKPHVSMFDNPLRRTAQLEATQAVSDIESQGGGVVVSIIGSETTDTRANNEIPAPPRITVRIDDAIRCALESECFKRRVGGEKTNVAEIARGILSDWAAAR